MLLMLFATASSAQEILYRPVPDSPIGERNPNAPEGTSQYEFLIGDWDVDVTLRQNGRAPLRYAAKWHNHWINAGE